MKNRPTYTRPNNRFYNYDIPSFFKITPHQYTKKENCQSKNFEQEFARLANAFENIIGNDVAPAKQITDNSMVCEQNKNLLFFFNENRQGHIELLNNQIERLRQKIDKAENKNKIK